MNRFPGVKLNLSGDKRSLRKQNKTWTFIGGLWEKWKTWNRPLFFKQTNQKGHLCGRVQPRNLVSIHTSQKCTGLMGSFSKPRMGT